MNELAAFLSWILINLTLIQLPATVKFLLLMQASINQLIKPEPTEMVQHDPSFLPKTTVILCLRGADPSLVHCLKGLLNQDYAHYDVQIIVDSEADPAWDILKPILATVDDEKVKVSVLQAKHSTCGLKCSSLLQAIAELSEDCQIVALLDADTIPHPAWLSDLVAPLVDPTIGATTGNRWYFLTGKQWGSIARYVQNVGAVVGMYFYEVAWAGTLAVRADWLRHPEFLEYLGKALVEDAPICQFMQSQGLKVQFVPSLLMTNQEECTLPQFTRWLIRQMVNTRLYHPRRGVIMGVGFITSVTPILAVLMVPIMLALGANDAALWTGISFLIFALFGATLPMLVIEHQVDRFLALRGELVPPFSPSIAFKKYLIMLPFAYIICVIVLIAAITRRTIEWRGITYQIDQPWNIRMIQYTPYQGRAAVSRANVSL